MTIIKRVFPLIILLVISFWSIRPFFNKGFFQIHDDTQVARVYEMHRALSDGLFPVRWVPDLGYGFGYPIFNFYAPLAYYLGGILAFLGFNALVVTKIIMAMGIIFAGIFMYFLSKEFWGRAGGLISASLYIYAPYHAIDIYVRGDLAEFWAYAFIPLAFFGIYKLSLSLKTYANSQYLKNNSLIKKSIWGWLCVSSLGYAAIILSHNLAAMMVTPFLFIFTCILYISLRTEERIYRPYFVILALLMGIALSAFYWLPVFPELTYTNVLSVVGGGSNYKDHFVCLSQLWNSPWGFGGSAPGCTVDGLSFKIGKLHILLSLLALPALALLFKRDKAKAIIIVYFIISCIFSIFLMLKESLFIWNFIPHMAFFQFPWRFLLLTSFFTSFLGGSIIYVLPKFSNYFKVGFTAALLLLIVFLNYKLFVPQKNIEVNSESYTDKSILVWKTSKASDEYLPRNFFIPILPKFVPTSRFIANKDVNVTSIIDKTQLLSFNSQAKNKTTLKINLAYFPAWHVFLDNKQTWFKYSNRGIILDIPKGKHKLEIKFIQTPIEKAGNAISIAGVIGLLIGIIKRKKDNYNG